MPRLSSSTLLAVVIAMQTACAGTSLSADEATTLVKAHTATRPTDQVKASAVSQAKGAVEAIAKVDVNGTSYNFKFRRYDKIWRWEFAETVGGQWIAPDVVMGEIHENARLAQAKEWAARHQKPYAQTIETLDGLCGVLPGYAGRLDDAAVVGFRRMLLRRITALEPHSAVRAQLLPLLQDELPTDAWGHRIELRINSDKRTGFFVSAGLDAKTGTADDLICVAEGRRGVDSDGDLRWEYTEHWSAPEGLESVVSPRLDAGNYARAEYTKVIAE